MFPGKMVRLGPMVSLEFLKNQSRAVQPLFPNGQQLNMAHTGIFADRSGCITYI